MQVNSADGAVIGYEMVGSGPALILVDGALCHRGAGPMRPLAATLASVATVVAYDRRGRGLSGDVQPYDVQREVDDLAALLEVVGGRAALFGMSSGGALALLAASRLGAARVPALAVYEPPYAPEAERARVEAYHRELAAALAMPDGGLALRLFLERVGQPSEAIDALEGSPYWAGMLQLAPTLRYDAVVMGDGAVPGEAVTAVAVPVLALAGERSPESLGYGARALAEAVGGEFALLPGQTHDVDPAVLAATLRGFLERVGG